MLKVLSRPRKNTNVSCASIQWCLNFKFFELLAIRCLKEAVKKERCKWNIGKVSFMGLFLLFFVNYLNEMQTKSRSQELELLKHIIHVHICIKKKHFKCKLLWPCNTEYNRKKYFIRKVLFSLVWKSCLLHLKLVMKIILLLQYLSNHPGSHCKQDPFSMWHMLSLQLIWHGMSQLLPYTPCFSQPIYRYVLRRALFYGYWTCLTFNNRTIGRLLKITVTQNLKHPSYG